MSVSQKPRRRRQIVARRVFRTVGRRPNRVVLTIYSPEPIPRSDWGCRISIRGLGGLLDRPRVIYGIDALQALELTMRFAHAVVEPHARRLVWLGEAGDLGLPVFMPTLPPPHSRRVTAAVEREWRRWVAAERRRARGTQRPSPGAAKKC